MISRRRFLAFAGGFSLSAAYSGLPLSFGPAQANVLEIAYAGSMTSVMEGPLKAAAESLLHVQVHGQAQGSNALAHLISSGSINPDVFISVTPSPMLAVLKAGKAERAEPIARTEMVIAYSRKSRFASAFDRASHVAEKPSNADSQANGNNEVQPWWKILSSPELRFGRTDPITDPQGRNIVFTLMLAAKHYNQPDLVEKILGAVNNPQQIFSEPTVQARLQGGELDAASAYKIQPGPFNLPYITLPPQINLGGTEPLDKGGLKLTVGGKTFTPEPLVYYAAALKGGRNQQGGKDFVEWLRGEAAQTLFRHGSYDDAKNVPPLTL
jgi:molybdate/tungstate transport system substrate-binding protein